MPAHTHCRICGDQLPAPFLDLGMMPLANSFLSEPGDDTERCSPLAIAGCCGLRTAADQLRHAAGGYSELRLCHGDVRQRSGARHDAGREPGPSVRLGRVGPDRRGGEQ